MKMDVIDAGNGTYNLSFNIEKIRNYIIIIIVKLLKAEIINKLKTDNSLKCSTALKKIIFLKQ